MSDSQAGPLNAELSRPDAEDERTDSELDGDGEIPEAEVADEVDQVKDVDADAADRIEPLAEVDQDQDADRADRGAAPVDHDAEGDRDGAGSNGVGRLEREGDIAADYLEELLDIADFDGDIDLDVENDRAMVSIVGSGLGNLVGQRGATLDALQDLTRLAVLRVTGERSRLMLDIAGTRARRKEQLHLVGTEAAEQARSSGEPVTMDPMTPFERKVVHDAVAAAGLRSESDGAEPNRRVVVYPS